MNKLLFILLIVLFMGCRNSATNKSPMSQNGIVDIAEMPSIPGVESSNNKSIEGVTFSIHKISEAGIKKLYSDRFSDSIADYRNFTCLYMDIQAKDFRDIVDYPSSNFHNLNDKIQYLSFLIKDDISILAGDKTYRCINSTFDRTFGQIPYARFFLVFEKIGTEEMTLQYNDYYFNKGQINLKI